MRRQLGADLRTTETYALGAFVGDLLTGRCAGATMHTLHLVPTARSSSSYNSPLPLQESGLRHSVGNPPPRVVWKSASPPTSASNSGLDSAGAPSSNDFLATPAGQRPSISVMGGTFSGALGAD
ncbi:MAG: hypothetical protein IPK17_15970 [Chloroflexi bacterium]|uniref:hypothetical protein n=1 Tax=Candidatus Flexifilum breve TaxID=3140694 RepID=UPI003136B025|nr:hypothetical protein [Chloroflexota bacterium]